jgi:hypothetical protein
MLKLVAQCPPLPTVLTPVIMCMCDYRQGFGLDIRFIDYLQVVTTNTNTIAISTIDKIMLSLLQPALSSLVVAW